MQNAKNREFETAAIENQTLNQAKLLGLGSLRGNPSTTGAGSASKTSTHHEPTIDNLPAGKYGSSDDRDRAIHVNSIKEEIGIQGEDKEIVDAGCGEIEEPEKKNRLRRSSEGENVSRRMTRTEKGSSFTGGIAKTRRASRGTRFGNAKMINANKSSHLKGSKGNGKD